MKSLSCHLIACLIFGCLVGCEQKAPLRASRTLPDKDDRQSTPSTAKLAKKTGGNALTFSDFQVVDLTHAFDQNTAYWPTASGFKLTVDSFGVTEKGYFYAANSFAAAEHGGTHIDAPIHFFKGHPTVDKIPLEQLMGEGVVIDVRDKCSKDRDYQVTVDDFYAWEEKHSRQLVDVIVLIRTGFGQYWPDRTKYMGTAERGAEAVAKLHFPGLHPDAARWLVEHRSIKAVGIDTPSIDYGQSTLFQSHVRLFEHNVPALENVAQMETLPSHGFQIIALPMKIGGGSGGPTRVIALLPKSSR